MFNVGLVAVSESSSEDDVYRPADVSGAGGRANGRPHFT